MCTVKCPGQQSKSSVLFIQLTHKELPKSGVCINHTEEQLDKTASCFCHEKAGFVLRMNSGQHTSRGIHHELAMLKASVTVRFSVVIRCFAKI